MSRECFCPNCGAVLDAQAGFCCSLETWRCKSCGQTLYRSDPDDAAVTWYCDQCGEILNGQKGFSDKRAAWVCTVCGFENRLSQEFIFDSVFDYEAHLVYDSTSKQYVPSPKTDSRNKK